MLNLRVVPILWITLLLCVSLNAQVKVSLSASSTGGCSPVTVTFTNHTTGASPSATYTWDYGNGNKITTPDSTYSSGATYVNPAAYPVTLTVTDGGKTYAQTVTVTVYNNPTVAFNITSGTKGCAPLPAGFSSTSTAGSGTIAGYFWDFGDGTTLGGTTPTTSHIYTFAGSPAVQLTVTNSDGCSATLQQPGLLTVSPSLAPSFSTDSTFLCSLADAVPFINTTTGPSGLTWLWRFGDGTTSTAPTPAHTYAAKGIYNVTLIATSSEGCVDSVEKTAYVNAQDFTPSMTIPSPICTGIAAGFSDNSTPQNTTQNEAWSFGDGTGQGGFGVGTTHTFYTPGNYTVTMTTTYGSCPASVTQTVTVHQAPALGGFVMQQSGACGAPETVTFKDTSRTAVKWAWHSDYYSGGTPFSTAQSASFTYTGNGVYDPELMITDANGCTANITEPLVISPPTAQFSVQPVNAPSLFACGPLTVTCSPTSNVKITQYAWNFGDGTTSTAAQPTHTYSTPGTYYISMSFTDSAGCTETAYGSGTQITISAPPKASFTFTPASPICGNTPIQFTNTSTNASYFNWNFGDGSTPVYNQTSPIYQYQSEGTYTVTLIATVYGFQGTCSDTLTETNLIKVLPSFPHILSVTNTCAGTRGLAVFQDSIRDATGITWSFGDGSTQTLSSTQDTISHVYTKSGTYWARLTTTNGGCTNWDSILVSVLLKQHPVLATGQTIVCADSTLNLSINGLDSSFAGNLWPNNYLYNPYYGSYYYGSYSPEAFQYGDGSLNGNLLYTGSNTITTNGYKYNIALSYLAPGKDSIRVIFLNYETQCYDTSNYVPIKISGPIVGFSVLTNTCYKDPILLMDTSRASFGGPIVQWQWTFGDGATLNSATGGTVSHVYPGPGTYYANLAVTDASGCKTSTTDINSVNGSYYGVYHPVQVNGPKAAFYWTPANITPGTTATFYNSTNGYYDAALWSFKSDGSTSTNLYSVNHTYPNITMDTVTLVVYSNEPGDCPSDTAVEAVPVRNVNAAFTYTSAYVNGTSCPPVVVYFTSTSFNVTDWSWDFGDGATSVGNPNPSHTYTKPGKYFITLTASGAGVAINVTDSVTVKGPYASVSVNLPQSCAPAQITLHAVAVNAVSYIWDFGDGTVTASADSVLTHTYAIPGSYTPTLTLADSLGCKASFNPGGSVLADTLHATVQVAPQHICDSGAAVFGAGIYSLSAKIPGDTLRYHWDFGTGNSQDTSASASPDFPYTQPGTYHIRLTVTSAPGCVSTSVDSVLVTRSDPGTITGPSEACAGDSLRFGATPQTPDTVTWQWLFPGGLTDTAGQAKPIVLPDGNFTVLLVADRKGCYDTTRAALLIHPLADIGLTPPAPRICLGDSVQLTAHDGNTYQWRNNPGLSAYDIPDPTAKPAYPSTYAVTVTTIYGCTDTDSVAVFVARPFQLQMGADTFVCKGNSIRLSPSGAYGYQWIAGEPISDTAAPNPLVDPLVNTTYTVVGWDADHCFTDTARVAVTIEPLPGVKATPVGTIPAGNSVQLAVSGSPDVTSWTWAPPDYLSCSDCSDPISTPRSSILYTVTGETDYGCKATDTVRITLICLENRVGVPKAFTPNNDGINDVFYPRGAGIRVITHFRIFGRWGNTVFERTNVPIDDPGSGWDGKINGQEQPVGAYVYELELVCDTGDVFVLKGTVMLER